LQTLFWDGSFTLEQSELHIYIVCSSLPLPKISEAIG
jgi:hypothetical protein